MGGVLADRRKASEGTVARLILFSFSRIRLPTVRRPLEDRWKVDIIGFFGLGLTVGRFEIIGFFVLSKQTKCEVTIKYLTQLPSELISVASSYQGRELDTYNPESCTATLRWWHVFKSIKIKGTLVARSDLSRSHPICGAKLRRRAGTCSRIPLRGRKRCAVHDREFRTLEAKKAFAGAAAWRAKQASRIARGEAKRFPQGRKRKHLVPRHWRFALSEAEEAAVLAHMVQRAARAGIEPPPWSPITSTTMEAKALASFERSLVIALNDAKHPLARDVAERQHDLARQVETALDLPGMDVRLKRLTWEIDQHRFRSSTPAAVAPRPCEAPAKQDAQQISKPAAARLDPAPPPHGPAKPAPPDSLFEPANDPPVETAQQRRDRELQAAYEFTLAVVAAGQATGRRRRELEDVAAARVPSPPRVGPRLTIAPWLYQR
jgi:hypothetical protein